MTAVKLILHIFQEETRIHANQRVHLQNCFYFWIYFISCGNFHYERGMKNSPLKCYLWTSPL